MVDFFFLMKAVSFLANNKEGRENTLVFKVVFLILFDSEILTNTNRYCS